MKNKMKKGFTLVEVLLALVILGLIAVISAQILDLSLTTTRIALEGFNNRPKIYENTFFMLNEIQSADSVELEDAGKTLIVNYTDGKQSLKYTIIEDTLQIETLEGYVPGGNPVVPDPSEPAKKPSVTVIEIDGDKSKFEVDGKIVRIYLTIRGMDMGKLQKDTEIMTQIFIRKK